MTVRRGVLVRGWTRDDAPIASHDPLAIDDARARRERDEAARRRLAVAGALLAAAALLALVLWLAFWYAPTIPVLPPRATLGVVALPLLTSSRLKAYRACPRLHYLRYELGWRAVADAAVLRFGDLMHRGLEAWWRARQDGDGFELEAARFAISNEADPFDRARAEALLAGYDARWSDSDLEVLAVEVEFRAPLVNPVTGAASRTYQLAGKMDVVVRDRAGRVLVMEHKTSSEGIEPGSTYWRRLRMDLQISIYLEGARALGYEPAACLYDVIGKPALRPLQVPLVDEVGVKIVLDASGQRVHTKDGKKWRETADAALGYVLHSRPETPDEYRARLLEAIAAEPERYFVRDEVVRLEGDVEDHAFDLWQTARAMREGELAGRAPRNPDACLRYGRPCEFFDPCSGAASLDDGARFVRDDNAHPELAADAVA